MSSVGALSGLPSMPQASASASAPAPQKNGGLNQPLSKEEQAQVAKLKARDAEVRAHEQAHKNVGGQYAGAISYEFQKGPDGRSYAVGGEVPIDASEIAGDPEATIEKMRREGAEREKVIALLKKDVAEREESIADKERRMAELKAKNKELEKFKFVLDYKIKELKKQIEPREVEIMEMKEQIREMDQELERYHKNNSALELTISDLRLKLDGMQREILSQRSKLGDADAKVRGLKTELHETIQHIQDPKALKDSVKRMYQKHVTETVASRAVEPDIAAEYTRQREYLEKSVESLKRKLNKNMELHRNDNARMMQENVSLIKEINDLRREIKGVE